MERRNSYEYLSAIGGSPNAGSEAVMRKEPIVEYCGTTRVG
jgi:hypothetical protein